MSVAQFSPILRQRIIEIYSDKSNTVDLANFGTLTRKELFKQAPEGKDLRARFESKDYHTSSITLEGLTAVTNKIVETWTDSTTKNIIEKFFSDPNFFYNFITYLENLPESKKYRLEEAGSTDYRLEKIPQKNLRDYFIRYVETSVPNLPKSALDTIKKNIQSGHLAGVFFLRLKTALGVKTTFSDSPTASYRDFTVQLDGVTDPNALKYLDSVLKAVLDADYLTSNLITNSQVFIDATKSVLGDSPRLYTELQFSRDNQDSGFLLKQTGDQLSNLIKAASRGEMSNTEKAIEELVGTLTPVVNLIFAKLKELQAPLTEQGLYNKILNNAQDLVNNLINAPGSYTLVEGIQKSVENVLKTGKIVPASTSKIKPKPIKQKHKDVLDISSVAKEFKKATQKIKQTTNKVKVSKTLRVRAQKPKVIKNISELLPIFNSNLVQKIKENMGDGSRKDILNLRTGRFAESVKVVNVTQSKAGMVSAFYSYMRNPYGTFSEGGRQQYPRSRDPKLLISKSIRELAQQQAINRLRAVLV